MSDRRERIVRAYLSAMEKGDLNGVLQCFAADGTVISPVYGEEPVRPFYEKLFADTISASVDLHSLYVSPTQPERLIAHFAYRWSRHGQPDVDTDLIDLFEFDPQSDRIGRLRIVFAPLPGSGA
ncbi:MULTISPECIES: nuclear transport factor 2 family protein [Sphingobium]|uniref:SnoaL-like domain-containing protein n=1 Tax=Sphingobium fuliginis ATCC 27551 TaxID=1208342 RepID=A0A5B8CLS5_SPHSA|nr:MULTISPECIES: nuclear transport factor 2 family protein [Sphingobium]OAP31247.1 hypothetical protein A8O16_14450 [Sphingobium sp. 20006FA]KXU31318.1 hypothetical protein AXW74_13315 [Sphingobium sp. AM]KYC31365.1 hypothetical protein A0J57_16545 [Sphingobium sp. 22B]MCB4859124.1 nuclear transport factor 2 family protein [Sphingobium sp. PNB]PNP99432.1 hypothetical protein A8G00_19580 [Sphingobium sp. SA916]